MINKILIIEDDVDMQEMLVSFLTLYGMKKNRILLASDPIQGLDLFKSNKEEISIVVCDYYMPKSNGAELCEIIKKNQAHTPIILQTGDINIQLKDNKYVDSVLHKPYTYEALIDVIEDLCAEPPEFDFKKQEERLASIDNLGMFLKFKSSQKNAHCLVLDKSDGGYKIVMKPTVCIKEKEVVEVRTTTLNFDDHSCFVDQIKKYEIVWYKLLSLDVCVVGLKLVL
jgi:CheY-like chemotaxis protein